MTNLVKLTGVLLTAVVVAPAAALPVDISYTDVDGFGFNDPTLGAQRRATFEAAVHTWTDQLQGTVPLAVVARSEAMGGDAGSATLAYAGPVSVARDFPNAQPGTWYVTALGNQLAGYDLDTGAADIEVVINADVDNPTVLGTIGFYYGTDGNSGGDIDFRTTVLHELGHGLGFISLMDTNGNFFHGPGDPNPLPDAYTRRFVKSKKPYISSKNKPMDRKRPKQRKKDIKSNNLRWTGPLTYAIQGFATSLYAPKKVEPGSSISHWDTSYFPDLLMEPFATGPKFNIDLSKHALQDMGWQFVD